MVASEYINRQGAVAQALSQVQNMRDEPVSYTYTPGWGGALCSWVCAALWRCWTLVGPCPCHSISVSITFSFLPSEFVLLLCPPPPSDRAPAGFISSLNHSFIQTGAQNPAYSRLFSFASSDPQSLKCILCVYLSFLYPRTLQIERKKIF